MTIKAYGYLRVSGKSQLNGSGWDRQEEAVNNFCNAQDYELVKVYQEQVSGTKSESDRPEFEEMVRAIMTNGVNTIIVESLDRLAREYRIQEQLLIYLASKGIDIISANTGENVTKAIQDDPMKKALIQMQGIFAELDKSLLVKKLRLAREKVKAETGKCGGAKRYGEDSPEEQAIIHKIKLKRRPNRLGKRLSLQAVADWLNEQGIKTKRGKEWSAMQVQRVLSY